MTTKKNNLEFEKNNEIEIQLKQKMQATSFKMSRSAFNLIKTKECVFF